MEVYKVFMDWKIIYGKDMNSPKLIYIVSKCNPNQNPR